MKLTYAATDDILNYAPYSRNCNLTQCKRAFYVPVPSLSEVQIFINLGTVKPSGIELTIINLCSPFDNQVLNSNCFIIAFNGDYWYAVYKNFTTSATYSSYLIAARVGFIDDTFKTYFSESYQNANICEILTKLSVCYPANWNAEDLNGIYIGAPDLTQPISGKASLYYHHEYYVRAAEVIETGNKITFTANLFKSFNTDLKRTFEFRPGELVPGWYKDYLLSVYFRGNININNTPALLTDINFENADEAADLWKAYAVLGREIKGAFGCSDISCPEDCVCHPVTLPEIVLPEELMATVSFDLIVPIGGTGGFTLSGPIKPDWLHISVIGNNLVFDGTPAPEDVGGESGIQFTLSNECGTTTFDSEGIIIIDWVEPETHFTETTFVSGDSLNDVEIANLLGPPGVSATVTLDNLININGGQLKVNHSVAFMGNSWVILLDGAGIGSFDVEIDGVTNPGTVILGHFTITSVDSGAIGTPDTFQISKVF